VSSGLGFPDGVVPAALEADAGFEDAAGAEDAGFEDAAGAEDAGFEDAAGADEAGLEAETEAGTDEAGLEAETEAGTELGLPVAELAGLEEVEAACDETLETETLPVRLVLYQLEGSSPRHSPTGTDLRFLDAKKLRM